MVVEGDGGMVRKTDEQRLRELEDKVKQLDAQREKIASRLKEKQRKERTRRLIQVGAVFEKYFDIEGEEEAEKVAYGMKDAVKKHKENLMKIDVEKSKAEGKVVYEMPEEKMIIPEGERSPYQTN